jgi:hypothetical protein
MNSFGHLYPATIPVILRELLVYIAEITGNYVYLGRAFGGDMY